MTRCQRQLKTYKLNMHKEKSPAVSQMCKKKKKTNPKNMLDIN